MLLEREGLLESLRQRLDDARSGTGSMVLVAGEAGAGKTSVVQSFVESLDDSTLVIQGACDPLTTPRPLSPLRDFAADPDSGLSGLIGDDRAGVDVFADVLGRLRKTIRPIVMIIEDAHWADEGTLDFLRFIGRRIEDAKAVVVVTYRDDEVGPDHPLRPVLGQLIPLASTRRLDVPALSMEAVTRLVSDQPFQAQELHRLTDGNAFFVTEILASGEGLPHSVQEAVLARVARLDERPRRVVEGVSVAPRSLEIEYAAALVGGSLEDIDEALSAGVLIGDGHSLRFRHELARSAVEDSLPPARRLSLHHRMLSLMEEDETQDLARLAHHAVRAGAADLVVEHAPAAATEASRRGAHKEAAAFLTAALDHADRIEEDRAAQLRLDLSRELMIVDRTVDAVPHVDLAIDHYERSGQRLQQAMALLLKSKIQWRIIETASGRASLDEAKRLFDGNEQIPELAEVYYQSAYEYMLARKGREAMRDIELARTTALESADRDLAWRLLMLDGCIQVVLGEASVGLETLAEAERLARQSGDFDNEMIALSMLGSGGGEARRYPEALRALERSIEQGLLRDQDYLVAYSRAWLARVAFEQGRWEEAAELAALVDNTAAHRSGIAILTALSALGRVRVRRGDPGGVAILEEMVVLGRDHELQHAWNAICGRAEQFWIAGDPHRGWDELEPAFRRALETDSEWARGEIGFWMWKTGAIDDPPEGAAEPFLLQMSGDWEAAASRWQEIGCPYETALALADGPAEAKLDALDIFDRLGARPIADRIRAELRDLGVERVPRGPTKDTLSNPAGLTGRQLEVLHLIVEGLSNDQIAERLFVSKKTVEHHVSAVYSKLGVSSRPKAIRAAAEIGAVEN